MRHLIVGNRVFPTPESENLRKQIWDSSKTHTERIVLMRELASREYADAKEFDEWMKDYAELTTNKILRRPEVWWSHDKRTDSSFVIQSKSGRR
jgi:hypothetical protein